MYASEIHPQSITPEELDEYLNMGFYRLGQKVFTTTFISFNHTIYDTIWLRIDLLQYEPHRTQLAAVKKCANFNVVIEPFALSEEKEVLYKSYILSRPFTGARSINSLLFDQFGYTTLFNSMQLMVYDGERLIGCGVFDLGRTSAEGIISFYDPLYQKYGLGNFIIYNKMVFCKEQKISHFYPGYFVPGYAAFDYKLSLAKSGLQYFEPRTLVWHDHIQFDKNKTERADILAKLAIIQEGISEELPKPLVYTYLHFYWSVIPHIPPFLQEPFFLFIRSRIRPRGIEAIVYNSREDRYRIVLLISKPAFQYSFGELLYEQKTIYTSSNPVEIIRYYESKVER